MTSPRFLDVRGLIIDANVLVLLVIGSVDICRISTHKRLSRYTEGDWSLLHSFLQRFRYPIYTTPTILTEASNLIGCDNERQRQELQKLQVFAASMQEVSPVSFETMNSYQISYLKFGFSDATIHCVAEERLMVMTDDLDFCYYLQGKGINAINFQNLRSDSLLR